MSELKDWMMSEVQRYPGNALAAVCGAGVLMKSEPEDEGSASGCNTEIQHFMGSRQGEALPFSPPASRPSSRGSSRDHTSP